MVADGFASAGVGFGAVSAAGGFASPAAGFAVGTGEGCSGQDLVAVGEGAQFGEDLGLGAGVGQPERLGAL
ncbi:hypothetical protein, partial [Streptomyces sp. NPDC002133]|uniref:hypothetical protein n=1 Tax=Streptomyces sp. NPDC002133 TaxID=3154409 RepID=UPI0033211AC0